MLILIHLSVIENRMETIRPGRDTIGTCEIDGANQVQVNAASNVIQELWFFLKLRFNESDEPCIFVLFLVDKLKLFYVILDNLIDGEGGTPYKIVLSVVVVVPTFDDDRHVVVTVAEFLRFNGDPFELRVEIIIHFFSFEHLYWLHIFT